jgi:hypothetical protein
MFKMIKNSVAGYKEKPVDYLLFKQDKHSNSIAVMFPGRGYTAQAPLFHYSTGVFLNQGFDVLHVNYDYTTEESNTMSLDEHITQITEDVKAVMDRVLKNHSYKNHTLIGKSIGTIALSSIVDRDEFTKAKVIWLTPLLQLDIVFDKMMESLPLGLCIIGDKDPCYILERYDQLCTKENLSCMLVLGTEHSLNYADNPIESIEVLKRVITEISKF